MFDWKDYLILAKELAKNPDEASKRSAISRAYYASQRTAYDFLESYFPNELKFSSQGKSSHASCWKTFSTFQPMKADRNLSSIGQSGERVKEWRVYADYEKKREIDADLVMMSIAESEEIILKIDKYVQLNSK